MTANTVYDVFMALPETEKLRLTVLINEYQKIKENKLLIDIKKTKKEFSYTKQDAMDYLLKNIFTLKK